MQLLLDSSGSLLVAALAADGARLASRALPGNSVEGRNIHAVVEGLLPVGRSIRELTAIGVGVGPGSFIGTRAAVSFANGLAAASGLPVHPLPTLAAFVGTRFTASACSPTAVLRDARRGEAYLHLSSDDPAAVELLPAGELTERLAAAGCTVVIAELPAPGDKRGDDWRQTVSAATAGCELRWAEHVPAEGLLALLPLCPARDFVEPVYLRGFL